MSNPTSTSSTPLWGRAWEFSVRLTTSDPDQDEQEILSFSGWDPEALRVKFDVLQSTLPSPYWFAEIEVYNLNKATALNICRNAVWATLKAGYQTGSSLYSIIWDGPILQVRFDRENVVDQVIKFNCLAGPWLLTSNFISRNQGPMSSQYDAVSKMIELANGNVDEQVSDLATQKLSSKTYPRGKTIFGQTSKYIAEAADEHFMQTWLDGNQSYISELANPTADLTPDLIYTPPFPPNYTPNQNDNSVTRSIIGVPVQSPFGCEFTVLLDPRLKVQLPPLKVKLDLTLVQQLKLQYPASVLTWLDQNGTYVAAQIRHVGDTRGNDWYTHVTGYQPKYASNLLNGVFSADSPGGQ